MHRSSQGCWPDRPRRSFIRFCFLSALSLAGIQQHCQAATPADFTVQSATDSKSFKLSDARGRIVAIHFLLKTECPFCLRHTQSYASLAASNPEVVHLFLKPDTDSEIRAWKEKGPADSSFKGVTIYRDADAKLAEQFGIPGGFKFHGQVVHFPALVVLDRQGHEVFRYVGKDNSDRFSAGQFRAKLPEWSAAK